MHRRQHFNRDSRCLPCPPFPPARLDPTGRLPPPLCHLWASMVLLLRRRFLPGPRLAHSSLHCQHRRHSPHHRTSPSPPSPRRRLSPNFNPSPNFSPSRSHLPPHQPKGLRPLGRRQARLHHQHLRPRSRPRLSLAPPLHCHSHHRPRCRSQGRPALARRDPPRRTLRIRPRRCLPPRPSPSFPLLRLRQLSAPCRPLDRNTHLRMPLPPPWPLPLPLPQPLPLQARRRSRCRRWTVR